MNGYYSKMIEGQRTDEPAVFDDERPILPALAGKPRFRKDRRGVLT